MASQCQRPDRFKIEGDGEFWRARSALLIRGRRRANGLSVHFLVSMARAGGDAAFYVGEVVLRLAQRGGLSLGDIQVLLQQRS